MLQGVTLLDPDSLNVRGNVIVGKDVIIDVGVIIEGEVVLGEGVKIGANCILKNVQMGDFTEVLPMSIIEDARIGQSCVIGPFARIRPDTLLLDGAKVGNFVEVKKSVIGEGSKVNHLSYIGDTQMGRNVNIGAGTITCNYDGAYKHKTTIGDNAFIGSDSQLVAPVTIGKGATIGAGSTICSNAPDEQLTLTRVKQKSVAGWKRPSKEK
jgi:bifunctional UDP-N-acetylglucosamine pyrophosphorylase/glucosamine-1-phosphate N-acetyltransferase